MKQTSSVLHIILWNIFIENCKMAYTPNQNLTVDEQLLPCKARCKFIQYIASKPDKFGLKFWLLVDAESKYMFNGFPYLGKKVESEDSNSTPTNVVLKLLSPLYNKGYNVTSDNYFTSLELSQKLSAKKCSYVQLRNSTLQQEGNSSGCKSDTKLTRNSSVQSRKWFYADGVSMQAVKIRHPPEHTPS